MGKANYLLQRVLNMDYKAMLDKISSIHKKAGRSRLSIFWDMQQCAVKYGAGYMDYDLFEMYNLTPGQRDTYLTRGRNNEIVAKYNDKAYIGDLNDKARFNALFAAFLHREWVPVTGGNRDDVMAFLGRNPVFMAKPTVGSCGQGIEKLRTADFPSLDALYGYLAEQAPRLELEAVIVQHPHLNTLYPGAVNTARVVTIRGRSGHVYFVAAILRMGSGGRFVDNFNCGGMMAPVDIGTGIVQRPAVDKRKNLYQKHPATGTAIQGFALPDWETAKELCARAAQMIPRVGYIGWDVCFTPDGPCLVEGNQYPGSDLYQFPAHTPDKIGMMPVFRAIEAQEAERKA